MITYEQALKIVKANSHLLGTEKVEMMKSINRVLREDVLSDMNMPPFDKSAMDGYACRREDIANELEVVETIQAGYQPEFEISKNQCAKIMTGAMIPKGADCVIIVEEVDEFSGNRIKYRKEKTADNICYKAEDVVVGQKLISAGTRITEKEIASLALTGCVEPLVSIKPKIGIITTGDEIVEPANIPQQSQIRNTNAYQLIAQCEGFGCDVNYYGIVKDTEEEISAGIIKAKQECDLILLTGGVSMGEFDLVPAVLKKTGFELLFEKVAVQPGKPTVFGKCKNTFVFGMPGNPVSSFIVFEFFAKEFLAGLMGLKNYSKTLSLEMAFDFKRKRNERLARIPVRINTEGKLEAIEYHGSAHISALAFADGIISVPIGVSEIKKGTVVDVRQI
ncbi:MAG: molybdopterin molybdotransferase MoeA [Ignavibacteria bacterium]|nr:molybdopterin molybdotransferase MoeA [Ignavibacteria bacterium]